MLFFVVYDAEKMVLSYMKWRRNKNNNKDNEHFCSNPEWNCIIIIRSACQCLKGLLIQNMTENVYV